MGMGFAVNPDFSFSLGYEHNHVFPQETELGTTLQHTTSLEVGAMTLGMAYRLSPTMSLNANFEFGVTAARAGRGARCSACRLLSKGRPPRSTAPRRR